MTDMRRYLTIAAAILGIVLLVSVAFAAANLDVAADHRNPNAEKAETEETESDDAENRDVEAKVHNGSGEDNHGQCVSKAAHHEADGLEGWRKGLFVSSVAQDETMVGDCDFSSHLEAALTAPEKGASESTGTASPSAAEESEEHGKESGQAKRAENAPDAPEGTDDSEDADE